MHDHNPRLHQIHTYHAFALDGKSVELEPLSFARVEHGKALFSSVDDLIQPIHHVSGAKGTAICRALAYLQIVDPDATITAEATHLFKPTLANPNDFPPDVEVRHQRRHSNCPQLMSAQDTYEIWQTS